jgi:hypothetical protein
MMKEKILIFFGVYIHLQIQQKDLISIYIRGIIIICGLMIGNLMNLNFFLFYQ